MPKKRVVVDSDDDDDVNTMADLLMMILEPLAEHVNLTLKRVLVRLNVEAQEKVQTVLFAPRLMLRACDRTLANTKYLASLGRRAANPLQEIVFADENSSSFRIDELMQIRILDLRTGAVGTTSAWFMGHLLATKPTDTLVTFSDNQVHCVSELAQLRHDTGGVHYLRSAHNAVDVAFMSGPMLVAARKRAKKLGGIVKNSMLLNNLCIDDEGLSALAADIRCTRDASHPMGSLYLHDNQFTGIGAEKLFAPGIQSMRTRLFSIDICHVPLGVWGIRALANAICSGEIYPKMFSLRLRDTQMCDKASKELGRAIDVLPELEILQICENPLKHPPIPYYVQKNNRKLMCYEMTLMPNMDRQIIFELAMFVAAIHLPNLSRLPCDPGPWQGLPGDSARVWKTMIFRALQTVENYRAALRYGYNNLVDENEYGIMYSFGIDKTDFDYAL